MQVESNKVWPILQGLPITLDTLIAELTHAINYTQTTLSASFSSEHFYKLLIKLLPWFHRTLRRVFQYFAGTHNPAFTISSESAECNYDDILLFLKECLKNCNQDLLLHLGVLSQTIALLALLNDKGTSPNVISLLNDLLIKVNEFSRAKQIPSCDLHLILSDSSRPHKLVFDFPKSARCSPRADSNVVVSLKDIINLHLGLVYLSEGNFKQSEKCLSNISSDDSFSQQYIIFIRAFVSFKNRCFRHAKFLLSTKAADMCQPEHGYQMLRNLCGCILSEEGDMNSAMRTFKTCLKLDGNASLPLYNLSLQYRRLGMEDTELQTLKALSNISDSVGISESNEDSESELHVVCTQCGIHITSMDHIQTAARFSRAEALHLLAKRCQELKRYEAASEKYIQLLEIVAADTTNQHMDDFRQTPLSLPCVSDIALECAFCLMHSQQLDKSISILNQILDGSLISSSAATDDETALEIGHVDACQKGKKRPLSESDKGNNSLSLRTELVALMYKSDSLVQLGELKDALTCLNRIVNVIEGFHDEDSCVDDTNANAAKKLKYDEVTVESVDVETQLLIDAYLKKAVLLVAMNETEDALETIELGVQLSKESSATTFNKCLILLRCERQDEAAKCWLKHRHMDHVKDASLLHLLLKQKIKEFEVSQLKQVKNMTPHAMQELDPTSLLNMDIIALKCVIKKIGNLQ